jgi:hypothetical protein
MCATRYQVPVAYRNSHVAQHHPSQLAYMLTIATSLNKDPASVELLSFSLFPHSNIHSLRELLHKDEEPYRIKKCQPMIRNHNNYATNSEIMCQGDARLKLTQIYHVRRTSTPHPSFTCSRSKAAGTKHTTHKHYELTNIHNLRELPNALYNSHWESEHVDT